MSEKKIIVAKVKDAVPGKIIDVNVDTNFHGPHLEQKPEFDEDVVRAYIMDELQKKFGDNWNADFEIENLDEIKKAFA